MSFKPQVKTALKIGNYIQIFYQPNGEKVKPNMITMRHINSELNPDLYMFRDITTAIHWIEFKLPL